MMFTDIVDRGSSQQPSSAAPSLGCEGGADEAPDFCEACAFCFSAASVARINASSSIESSVSSPLAPVDDMASAGAGTSLREQGGDRNGREKCLANHINTPAESINKRCGISVQKFVIPAKHLCSESQCPFSMVFHTPSPIARPIT
jgi:hypothetical protein